MQNVNNRLTATVHTTTVEIKTLQIGNKMVTLTLFRQIPEACIICPVGDGKTPKFGLIGEVWGVINYVWKGCEEWARCHLLWQYEGKLYRTQLANPEDEDYDLCDFMDHYELYEMGRDCGIVDMYEEVGEALEEVHEISEQLFISV